MIHGAERRAIAEMATHQPQLVRPAFQKLRGPQRDIVVRRAVEAIAPHRFLFVKFVGQAVKIRRRAAACDETRYRTRRHAAPPETAGASRECPRAFTGLCNGASGLSASICARTSSVIERSFGELLAAMHHPMRDHADFACAADDAGFLRGQLGRHRLECFGEVALAAGRASPRPSARDASSRVPSMPMRSTSAAGMAGFIRRCRRSCT